MGSFWFREYEIWLFIEIVLVYTTVNWGYRLQLHLVFKITRDCIQHSMADRYPDFSTDIQTILEMCGPSRRITQWWRRNYVKTTLFSRNYVKMTSFCRYNDVIITSCFRWGVPFETHEGELTQGLRRLISPGTRLFIQQLFFRLTTNKKN